MNRSLAGFLVTVLCLISRSAGRDLELIRVSPDGQSFIGAKSGSRFNPWGFNYDHDRANRLLETYWTDEWNTVAEDFREMKDLGANIVRIHLQVGRFMKSPDTPDEGSLQQLARLVQLAESNHLYLDITGLACYDKSEVPGWYNDLPESERWNAQGRFWEAVARTNLPSKPRRFLL